MAFMRDLCAEIIAVMRVRGVPIMDEEDPFRPIIGSLKALGKNRPSMWQDLARGTRTEVDALNGAIVREAERLGLKVPHNAALVRFIHSRERQKFLRKQEIVQRLGLDRARAAGEEAPRPRLRTRIGTARCGRGDAARRPAAREHPAAQGADAHVLRGSRRRGKGPRSPGGGLLGTGTGGNPAGARHRPVLSGESRGPDRGRAPGRPVHRPRRRRGLLAVRQLGHAYGHRSPAHGHQSRSPTCTASPGHRGPDLVLYSTNTGHELVRWFQFYGSHFGVPVMGLHPPPALDVLERIDVDASVHQLLRLQRRLEESTGRTLDMDRLGRWWAARRRPPSCGATSSAWRVPCQRRSRSSTRSSTWRR